MLIFMNTYIARRINSAVKFQPGKVKINLDKLQTALKQILSTVILDLVK